MVKESRSFVLAVDFKVGSVTGTHFVCREERTGKVFEAVRLEDHGQAEAVTDFLQAWMLTYKPRGVSATLAAVAKRRGIKLPSGLRVIDLASRRTG